MQYPDSKNPLKIGTRGSPLALAQAHETRARLAAALSLDLDCFAVEVITTTGDRIQDRALLEIGGKGLFTKEIEEALLAGRIDIAVHSSKDMPTVHPNGLVFDCFLPREDPRDAFVSLTYSALGDLPVGAVVGTSSLRRRAQLLNRFPHVNVVEFRGNVQTRLRKLNEGLADATFLAMAGLNRLGEQGADVPASAIDTDDMLPAVAQGAIGIECRANDGRVREMLGLIGCHETRRRVTCERAFLAALDGSCQTPIAGLAQVSAGHIELRGEILRPDGRDVIRGTISGISDDAVALGDALGRDLKAQAGPGFFGS